MLDTNYIKVTLARPVPTNGQGRIVIVKTYEDAKSYYVDGKTIVFDRPLGVRRNKVVLPAGYEVVGLTVPSQMLTESDGRIAISFMNNGGGPAPLVMRATKGAQTGAAAVPKAATKQRSWESPFEGETEEDRLSERAHQDRDIVYFLQQPETHAFALYHDYTETRAGVNGYANVVRKGSIASNPSASILDTGEQLQAKEMSGAEMIASKINAGETVEPDARVVVIPFPAVQAGQSLRLRIAETYTAPVSYKLDGEDLVFDRSLGRPRNAVVLPSGWYCTFSAIPATVTQLPDGRVRLDYWNGRPEPVNVLLKARRRVGPCVDRDDEESTRRVSRTGPRPYAWPFSRRRSSAHERDAQGSRRDRRCSPVSAASPPRRTSRSSSAARAARHRRRCTAPTRIAREIASSTPARSSR